MSLIKQVITVDLALCNIDSKFIKTEARGLRY